MDFCVVDIDIHIVINPSILYSDDRSDILGSINSVTEVNE